MGVTLDTGALIALEAIATGPSGNRTAYKLATLLARKSSGKSTVPLVATTPAVVVGEWWREQRGPAAKLLDANRIRVEDVTRTMAERAGAVLASIKSANRSEREQLLLVDAIVVVTAASRGDVIYTSDVDDLERLRDAGNLDVKIFGI